MNEAQEKTVRGETVAEADLVVENPQGVTVDNYPSTSGVFVNGNPTSKELEGNQGAISTSETETNKTFDHFQVDGRNEKHSNETLEKVYHCTYN